MTVDSMIRKLQELRSEMGGDAEVFVQLEKIDNLPRRQIAKIALHYDSDTPETDYYKRTGKDRVMIQTATAHLNPVE